MVVTRYDFSLPRNSSVNPKLSPWSAITGTRSSTSSTCGRTRGFRTRRRLGRGRRSGGRAGRRRAWRGDPRRAVRLRPPLDPRSPAPATASPAPIARPCCSRRRGVVRGKASGRSGCRPTTASCHSSDATFDAALNLFCSLGYRGEEGDRRTLGELRRVLRPGGALVVETIHRDALMRIFQPRGWDPLPDGGLLSRGTDASTMSRARSRRRTRLSRPAATRESHDLPPSCLHGDRARATC